ncbi:hypothetical protein TNCV_1853891 [Trichonephila clavipes]|nr:hypothetical protein TNCV_1853891 [Trichonephila clavipes]
MEHSLYRGVAVVGHGREMVIGIVSSLGATEEELEEKCKGADARLFCRGTKSLRWRGIAIWGASGTLIH